MIRVNCDMIRISSFFKKQCFYNKLYSDELISPSTTSQGSLFNISLHVFLCLICKREIHWAIFAVINKEWVQCDESKISMLNFVTLQPIAKYCVSKTHYHPKQEETDNARYSWLQITKLVQKHNNGTSQQPL